jgi:hypothetical protein
MVEIDLMLDLPKEELERRVKEYYERGYRWSAYYEGFDPDFRILTPKKYFVNSQSVIEYFRKLKKLEVGNAEQAELKECLELIGLLRSASRVADTDDELFNLLHSDLLE